MRFQLDLRGVAELEHNLLRLEGAVLHEGVRDAALAGGEVISELAQMKAPRRTGRSADSIAARIKSSNPTRAEVTIGPGRKGWILWLHEYGTKHMRARPFLRPAADEAKDAAVAVARDVFREKLLAVPLS